MPTRNVNLTGHCDNFIDATIATGRFSNASEAVTAGLHLLELQEAEHQAKIEWLRGLAPYAYVYHLIFSRKRVVGEQVKAPRHFVLYRLTDKKLVCAFAP